jgi:RimJ/RimL family protein N-acetyltransferase
MGGLRNVGDFFRKAYRSLKRKYNDVLFFARNIYGSFPLKQIPETDIDEQISICGSSRKELREALHIYSFFNNKNRIDISKYIIYFLISKKMIFIAKDISVDKIVGMELYYFNSRDIRENTIHQGFRGILPAWQGKGIGTSITSHAINHFKNSRLDGISSRVSLNNPASLHSNMKLGFGPVEEYFDENMQEKRYYLICPFDKHDHWEYLNYR